MPQDLGLADQRGDAFLLQRVRRRVRDHELDRLVRVLPRAGRRRREIIQHVVGDPRIVPLPGQDTPGHEVWGEEFGQRRCDGLDETALAHELNVPVAGEAHAGKHRAARRHFLTINTHTAGHPQPELQSPLAGDIAVVTSDAAVYNPPRIPSWGYSKQAVPCSPTAL